MFTEKTAKLFQVSSHLLWPESQFCVGPHVGNIEDRFSHDLAHFCSIDNKVCYQDQVFLFTSSPARTSREDGGLFCIYYDNCEYWYRRVPKFWDA